MQTLILCLARSLTLTFRQVLYQSLLKSGLSKILPLPVVILSLGLCLGSCEENDLKKVESIMGEDLPMEEGRNVEVIYTDSARLKARIMATILQKREGEDGVYLEMKEGVKARFYNDQGELSSRLKANKGTRYLEKHKTVVRENVVVVNRKNDTLSTEEMIWDERKNKVYSEKFVKVRTAEEIIYANGFESDPSFTEYEFYDIEGTISVDNPQEP